ncbi:MAG TPA: YiaA/YiaB family inner membrane protein [Polyangiaceae bacterium]|nr:YiaA/YiaB family inner membrane protein [Polyangiaceae bacterium]
MIRNEDVQRDTPAWIFQVWASFALAVGTTAVGIVYMPLDPWMRAFFAMGLVFSVGSSLTLAKTLRDNHEARRLINRLSEAKAEKIIREFEVNDASARAGA